MIYGRRGRRAPEVFDNPNATAKERIASRKSRGSSGFSSGMDLLEPIVVKAIEDSIQK